MAKKKKVPVFMEHIDPQKTYYCNMVRENTRKCGNPEDLIPINIYPSDDGIGYDLIPKVEGYETKYFFDLLMEFLFFTRYISEEKELNKNYKIVES